MKIFLTFAAMVVLMVCNCCQSAHAAGYYGKSSSSSSSYSKSRGGSDSGSRQSYGSNTNNYGGNGQDQQRPTQEGSTFALDCGVSLDGGKMLSCIWKHLIRGDWSNGNQDMHVTCGSASPQCSSSPQLGNYASRLSLTGGESSCSINIRSAHPMDTGEWSCHVIYEPQGFQSSGTPPAKMNKFDVFVSNRSTIAITEPDQSKDRSVTIKYKMGDTSSRIQSTCTAYGGLPRPSFHWFVDDDRNEISERDADIDERSVSSDGRVMESTIRFSPDLEKLCREYKVDKACRIFNDKEDFSPINFDLICKVDQGQYYVSENDQQQAKVIVEASSGTLVMSNIFLVVLACVVTSSSLSPA